MRIISALILNTLWRWWDRERRERENLYIYIFQINATWFDILYLMQRRSWSVAYILWGHHMEDIPPQSLCINLLRTRSASQSSHHTHYRLFQGWTGSSVFSLCTHTLGQLTPSVQHVCGWSHLHEGKLGLSRESSTLPSNNMLIAH